MIGFRLDEHALHGRAVCEVWQDGAFIAALYATDDGVKLISKHQVEVAVVDGHADVLPTQVEITIRVEDKEPGRPAITCPFCGFVSHNPHDIAERYCGLCHRFQEPEQP